MALQQDLEHKTNEYEATAQARECENKGGRIPGREINFKVGRGYLVDESSLLMEAGWGRRAVRKGMEERCSPGQGTCPGTRGRVW